MGGGSAVSTMLSYPHGRPGDKPSSAHFGLYPPASDARRSPVLCPLLPDGATSFGWKEAPHGRHRGGQTRTAPRAHAERKPPGGRTGHRGSAGAPDAPNRA